MALLPHWSKLASAIESYAGAFFCIAKVELKQHVIDVIDLLAPALPSRCHCTMILLTWLLNLDVVERPDDRGGGRRRAHAEEKETADYLNNSTEAKGTDGSSGVVKMFQCNANLGVVARGIKSYDGKLSVKFSALRSILQVGTACSLAKSTCTSSVIVRSVPRI